ncbi:MAG TPA: hypothetical protein VD906_10855 [Caulobacteraceae bacterium]|nr:hypothetical protein [Caulobacteraceae bacterium]
MAGSAQGSNNCDESQAAAEAADRFVDRLQERTIEPLKPDGKVDEEEVFYEIVEELETAPEVDQIRRAAGSDPKHYGQATRLQRGGQVIGKGAMYKARDVASIARRKPASTGLLVVGAVAGGALLLNPALRRLAITAAPTVWKMVRRRRQASG